ncbi:MAG: hypothetical protein A2X36_09125 [Elusimicrobia bacterium GWA2_69_24]|nr:MAG: hypothetical protein A2X36_09125 [Elusimicrobia bacterium GWA2_69_24]HBL18556.1 hypothetical protein [Elusimicrobiota bacterium]
MRTRRFGLPLLVFLAGLGCSPKAEQPPAPHEEPPRLSRPLDKPAPSRPVPKPGDPSDRIMVSGDTGPTAAASDPQAGAAACRAARGTLKTIRECDGSKSQWCVVSAREACYADQLKDGKCTVGKYSQDLNAVVGVKPRVICSADEHE